MDTPNGLRCMEEKVGVAVIGGHARLELYKCCTAVANYAACDLSALVAREHPWRYFRGSHNVAPQSTAAVQQKGPAGW